MKLENTIIYLIGFSGTGKFSIAQEIHNLTGAIIVDNQLINNPIFQLFARYKSKAEFPPLAWLKMEGIRDIVLETIVELTPPESNFIFTNELFERDFGDSAIFAKIASVATARNASFLPIRLICEQAEHIKRATSVERKARMKLTDADEINNKIMKYKLYVPKVPHQTLDVTKLSPAEATKVIILCKPKRGFQLSLE